MKSRTALIGLIGLIGLFIVVLGIKATGPGSREKRENGYMICQPDVHHAKVGEDVTLDCQYKGQVNLTDQSIGWKFNKKFNETITVLVYKSRANSIRDQAPEFRDRASMDSSWNLPKGKFAVKIPSVKITDAGVYTCFVGTRRQEICSTTLKIQSDSEKQAGSESTEMPTTNQGLKSMADMVTLVLGASAMLYLQHY